MRGRAPYGSYPPTCSVRAWLATLRISEGAAFPAVSRHGHLHQMVPDRAVADMVRRPALAAGLDGLWAEHPAAALQGVLAQPASQVDIMPPWL